MPEMTPEEMAMMQEQAAGAEGGGDAAGKATQLAKQVGDGLSQLGEMLNGSQAATDQDRSQMAQIMELYIDLVERKLGGAAPGQDAPPEEMPAGQGAAPAMGGAKGVPMGPQGRN